MIYCFDTSAINRLLDDPEREPIVKATLSVGSFRVTAYNVVEAAKTADATRRSRLIELMWRLADGKRPLDRPNTILLTYAAAHAAHARFARINADENLDGVWIALNQPDLLDQNTRGEVCAWADSWEDDFSETVAGDRDQFQTLFREAPHERPSTTAATLRAYLSKTDECRSLVSDIYKRQLRRQLTDAEYEVLVREPVWPLYFLGYAYAVHQRAIKEQHFSEKRNAGAIDLSQAVYLTLAIAS